MSPVLRRFSRTILHMALVAGYLGFGQAHAEDAVVVASTVPGYTPGMVISSADRLSMPEGASTTLLFQSGEMLRLGGPFEGTLGQSAPEQRRDARNGSAAMIAEMFRLQGADATVIGGTRSTSLAHANKVLEDVEVDPQRSGTYCVGSDTSVWIARPANASDSYAVQRKGTSRMLSWPLGTNRIEWPQDVMIEDGGQFEIATRGAALATVSFRVVPASVAAGPAMIASGLMLGCRDQFDAQLRRLSRSVAKPELWITSDHGRRPTYHVGEPILLTFMANTDGYLYCVSTEDDGSTRLLFPAGAVEGAQLRGSEPLSIPGRRQKAGLRATPGTTQIHCWLADRDITPELPHALLGSPSTRVPDQLNGNFDTLFGRMTGTRIEAGVLTINVE